MDQFLVGCTSDEWFPSRLSFGRFKGRLYQKAEAREAEKEIEELMGEAPF